MGLQAHVTSFGTLHQIVEVLFTPEVSPLSVYALAMSNNICASSVTAGKKGHVRLHQLSTRKV